MSMQQARKRFALAIDAFWLCARAFFSSSGVAVVRFGDGKFWGMA